MAFFMPRTVFHSTPFNPLLSLLSELDQVEAQPRRSAPVRRQSPCQAQRQSCQAQRQQAPCQPQPQRHSQPAYRLSVRPWEPRFASHETDDSFVIYGEVPGLNKDHVTIEFPEPRKLVVSGRASTEPAPAAAPTAAAAAETESTTESKTVSEGSAAATNDDATAEDTRSRSSFQATVEDDEDSEDFEVLSQHSGRSQPEKAPEAQQQQQQQQPKSEPQVQADEPHAAPFTSGYTVREFSRYFNFPTYVDHDAVTASLRDGLLTITVPKARAPEPRRIIIN